MKCLTKTIILAFIFFTVLTRIAYSQTTSLTELKERLQQLQQQAGYLHDTAYLNILNRIAFLYADSYPDSALALVQDNVLKCQAASYKNGEVEGYKIKGNAYQTKGNYTESLKWYDKSYDLAKKINYTAALPAILNNIATIYTNQGNYEIALKKYYEALKLADADNNKFVQVRTLNNIAVVRFYEGNMKEAETVYEQTLVLEKQLADTIGVILALNNIAEVNIDEKKPRESLQHLFPAYRLAIGKRIPEMLVIVTVSLGNTYLQIDSTEKAITYFDTALRIARRQDYGNSACNALIGLAKAYKQQGQLKSALDNGLEALAKAEALHYTQLQRDANEIISGIYEATGNPKEALAFFKKYKIYSDSLTSVASARAATNYKANYEFEKKEQDLLRRNLQQRWLAFSALAALIVLGIVLFIVNRNKRRLNNTYKEVQHKNIVIESQRRKAEETLAELKSAQAQLIQAEKMASLGELTAGIAHEIQNPLNFVNNFSEVSNELLEELMDERSKPSGERNEELEEEIMNDISGNMQKILHHGKQADGIVKAMLQHSKAAPGKKEWTDINALADEALRLSFHGLRAKDKTFNATIYTEYDENTGKINIIPQDISRVLLNLFNNAFYAVNEKKQKLNGTYEPKVSVFTKTENNNITIAVHDNGTGIQQNITDKIFQPFFTTKPPGQGTGLGLSLSYDIIKAHRGEIKVESKEAEGSALIIRLPKE